MRRITRVVLVTIVSVLLVPFLTDLHFSPAVQDASIRAGSAK